MAALASGYASHFGADDWGRLAGLWHDLGKYSAAFQRYLIESSDGDTHTADVATRVDHSTAGAQHAVETFPVLGHVLAFILAGHHAGLPDGLSPSGSCLRARLEKTIEPWAAPEDLLVADQPGLPPFLQRAFGARDAFPIAFFTRMVFSCLVDADFVDTEAFMDPARAAERPSWPPDILTRMEAALGDYVSGFGTPSTAVDRQRRRVYELCLAAAERSPGLYSLTVPTGGGKTLSSLAFALRHAERFGLRRVVYVAPFTSIIDQNAGVFRSVMEPLLASGLPDVVVEHHSNLDVGPDTAAGRRASENWAAPLIVTTCVQFYESLFANRTSRCRKLHNLSRSVVILDEAQALPVDYLEPCLRALKELCDNYGASVVLCTATQPAIRLRDSFPIGLVSVEEIVPDPARLHADLRRVSVQVEATLDDDELSSRLLQLERVLCIVNTRKHARSVFDRLGAAPNHVHLSALMCPAHRTQTLTKIGELLDGAGPVRVISTQLIEAGVDIDFPYVYRSLAGMDSIAQAAGRCNRHGTLKRGTTVVFSSDHRASERFLSDTTNTAAEILPLYDDPLDPEAVEHYFSQYYWQQSERWDTHRILDEFHLLQDPELPFLFNFRSVAERFRLIEDGGEPVIIPWGSEGKALCEALRHSRSGPTKPLLRRLQRYVVQIPARTWTKHVGLFDIVHDQYPILADVRAHYSCDVGLALDGPTLLAV